MADNKATPGHTATWYSRKGGSNDYKADKNVDVKCTDGNDDDGHNNNNNNNHNNNGGDTLEDKIDKPGPIAGIAIGGLLVLGLIVAGLVYALRKDPASSPSSEPQATQYVQMGSTSSQAMPHTSGGAQHQAW